MGTYQVPVLLLLPFHLKPFHISDIRLSAQIRNGELGGLKSLAQSTWLQPVLVDPEYWIYPPWARLEYVYPVLADLNSSISPPLVRSAAPRLAESAWNLSAPLGGPKLLDRCTVSPCCCAISWWTPNAKSAYKLSAPRLSWWT